MKVKHLQRLVQFVRMWHWGQSAIYDCLVYALQKELTVEFSQRMYFQQQCTGSSLKTTSISISGALEKG